MPSTSLFPVSGQPFALSPRQQRIYEGLCAIREDIGQFYWDAVEVMHYPMLSKTHLVAHLCREIDGGLRDVLELEQDKKRYEKEHKEELLQVAEEAQLYDAKGKPTTGNIASVIVSGGETVPKELIAEWVRISNSLARFAHRDSNNQQPRDISEFQELWESYERVLDHLVGTYYKRLDRIDRLLLYDTPPAYALASLRHQVEDQTVSRYFFTNLNKPGWLEPLQQAGFFERSGIPDWVETSPGSFTYPGWPQIFYLRRMALEFPATHPLLREIVGALIANGPLQGEKYAIDQVNIHLPEIMVTISGEEFSEEYTEFICQLIDYGKLNSLYRNLKENIFPFLIKNNLTDPFGKILKRTLSIGEAKDKRNDLLYYHLKHTIEPLLSGIASWKPDIFLQIVEEIIISGKDEIRFNGFFMRSHLMRDQSHSAGNGTLLGYLGGTLLNLAPQSILEDWVSRWLSLPFPTNRNKMEYSGVQVLKAIAIYCIEFQYEILGNLFWNIPGNPLIKSWPQQEVYSLLRSCYSSFTERQWQQLLAWIEALEQEEWNTKQQSVAWLRKEWLYAVRETGRPEIQAAYERYELIAPGNIRNTGFDTKIKISVNRFNSPISVEEIAKYNDNKSLVIALNQFDFSEDGGYDSPDQSGLENEFKQAVKEYPAKFFDSLSPFIDLPEYLIYPFTYTLIEICRKEPAIYTKPLLAFFAEATTNSSLWRVPYIGGSILRFLAGRLGENEGISSEMHEQVESIIDLFAHQYPANQQLNTSDRIYPARIDNMPAQVLYVYIWLAVRKGDEFQTENKWHPALQKKIVAYIKEGKENPDLYGVMGDLLSYLFYLSIEWVLNNISLLINNDEQKLLIFSMGYFNAVSSVHEGVYMFLKENNVFSFKIISFFLQQGNHDSTIYLEKLIRHVGIAYHAGWESLDNDKNLLHEVLEHKIPALTTMLVKDFVEEKEYNPRIYTYIAEWVDWETIEWQECRQYMLVWALCGDKLTTQTVEWVSRAVRAGSVPYDYLLETVIERLLHHVERYPALSGEILYLLVASLRKDLSYGIDIEEDGLTTIVKKLFLHKQTDLAVEICSAIGKLGYDFLRNIETTFRPIADRTPEEWYDEVFTYFPDAVLCGYTAWYYHGFSTFSPWEYYLVTQIAEKPELPDHLKIVCWEYPTYLSRIGIEEVIRPNGQKVRITDPERSVCDLILFENQVDAEVFREVLNNYFQGRKSNITRLLEYASALGIEDRLRTFMKVLI